MTDGIFVIRGDLDSGNAELFEMKQAVYDSEDVLQTLLERYPELLAGGQMNPESPRRWLLLGREQPIPDKLDGYARWSLDHLFVDQDGVPTLVEVKRSTDTRIRREVVGQMLDYAANAVGFWPVERLRADFESHNVDSASAIANALGSDVDEETLWTNVRNNLESGNLRLVFLADEIPRELRRIVEFLNKQMAAEVLAVEVGQYVAGQTSDLRTLVARVHGLIDKPREPRPTRDWNEESFFKELEAAAPEALEPVRAVFSWAVEHKLTIRWGKGATFGGFRIFLDRNGPYSLAFWTSGSCEIPFANLARQAPFASDTDRLELARRLREVPLSVTDEQITKYPNVRMDGLMSESATQRLIGVLDWMSAHFTSLSAT